MDLGAGAWQGLDWRVHDIRGVANQIPLGEMQAWGAAFAGWYGTVEPLPTKQNIHCFDIDDEDEDDEDSAFGRCPFCIRDDTCDEGDTCQTHRLASIDDDEGVLGGTVYDGWADLVARLKEEVFDTLVGGRRRTGRGSEMDSIVQQLRDAGFKWRSHDPMAKAKGRQPDPEQAREPFDELCCELGVDRTIRLYMEEVLVGLPGVEQRHFEISTAPGLTWVGSNYWALDAVNVAEQFGAAFE